MKKFIISVFFVVSIVSFVWSNGDTITREISVQPFEKIWIRQGYVRFHSSNETRVTATVDSDLVEFIDIHVRNQVLTIGLGALPDGTVPFKEFTVDVYCISLDEVTIRHAGMFECMDEIKSPTFTANISGAGTIKGNIRSDIFDANISGTGTIEVNIQCDIFDANISGTGTIEGNIQCDIFNLNVLGGGFATLAGNANESKIAFGNTEGGFGTFGTFDGKNFVTKNATMYIEGPSTAKVYVTEKLDGSIVGNGEISYYGDPQINIKGNRNNVKRIE